MTELAPTWSTVTAASSSSASMVIRHWRRKYSEGLSLREVEKPVCSKVSSIRSSQ